MATKKKAKDEHWERFEARMYGVYPEDGFPDDCLAIFPSEQGANDWLEMAAKPENGELCTHGLIVLTTDVKAAMWNSASAPTVVAPAP